MDNYLPFKGHEPEYDPDEYHKLERTCSSMETHVIKMITEMIPLLWRANIVIKNASRVLHRAGPEKMPRLQVIVDLSENTFTMAVRAKVADHMIWLLEKKETPHKRFGRKDVPRHRGSMDYSDGGFSFAYQTTIEHAYDLASTHQLSRWEQEQYLEEKWPDRVKRSRKPDTNREL